MATFRVGDRVRIRKNARTIPGYEWVRGMECVLVGPGNGFDWETSLRSRNGIPVDANNSALEPLTPPAQDEWADAKVKQVTKPVYTEPERVKERAHG